MPEPTADRIKLKSGVEFDKSEFLYAQKVAEYGDTYRITIHFRNGKELHLRGEQAKEAEQFLF